eukprot:GHVU01073720.1.p1 GENE.GHVU01073720.1~~GHVU01073720.1.p1  ORF type:complete len:208 (+),score=36.37 GHVU01073720.1:950-1573(+)
MGVDLSSSSLLDTTTTTNTRARSSPRDEDPPGAADGEPATRRLHVAEEQTGPPVRVIDVGVGANCVYSLLGAREYGMSFVGTDVSQQAVDIARGIVERNGLNNQITFRMQTDPDNIFEGVFDADERFDLCVCNPPFYERAEEVNRNPARELEVTAEEGITCGWSKRASVSRGCAPGSRRCSHGPRPATPSSDTSTRESPRRSSRREC